MGKRIIVIGTGGAGLVAAIAARKAGADVTAVSKTCGGLASCTAYSAGLFTLACGGVTPEEHYSRTMKAGMNAGDPELVATLSADAEKSLQKLAEWGITVKFSKGRASVRGSASNPLMGGGGLQEELVRTAAALGVRFADWSVVTSLAITGGRVTGAATENWRNGSRALLPADAVIIACGGGGQIYSHTDNPARITGGGYALALKAGLELRDMEFVQFYPLGWNEPGFPKWMADVALVDYVRVTDSDGDDFLKKAIAQWGLKDGREANLYARDRCAALVAEKDAAGGVFVHLEDAESGTWNDSCFQYCLTINSGFFDGHRKPLRAAPLEHYFCGGVKIDARCRTGVNGLYACGEATSGVDGANRVGGNALSNIVTFGLRAGETAAAECGSSGRDASGAAGETLFRISPDGHDPAELRKELQCQAWRAIGPIRRKNEMENFLSFIESFKKNSIRIETPYQRLLALEMEELVLTAQAVTEAALKREQSLGTHCRAD